MVFRTGHFMFSCYNKSKQKALRKIIRILVGSTTGFINLSNREWFAWL